MEKSDALSDGQTAANSRWIDRKSISDELRDKPRVSEYSVVCTSVFNGTSDGTNK